MPSTYLYSVPDGEGEQLFDWPENQLHLRLGAVEQVAPLEFGTQDRIS